MLSWKTTVLLLLLTRPAAAADGEITAAELMEKLPALAGSVPEPPEVSEDDVIALEENDPETYIFINRAKARPPRPVRLGGDGRLTLTRAETGEKRSVVYRRSDGSYDRAGMAAIDRLLRCRLTGKRTDISVKLMEILDAVEDRFGGRGLLILSAYRTPTLNKYVPGAARWSLHMLGWAADVRVPGVNAALVADFAAGLKAGGVGLYRDAAFVHLDSGRTRRWETGLRR